MVVTIFLGKVIGWYFFILGLWILLRQDRMKVILAELGSQGALRFFMGMVGLILGLLLVHSHNVWVLGWPLIITLVGWVVLIAGLLRLFLPDMGVHLGQWWVKNPPYLMVLALVYIIIGLFLLYSAHFI
jgi:hypothetical protein